MSARASILSVALVIGTLHGRILDDATHPMPYTLVALCEGVKIARNGYACGKHRYHTTADASGHFAISGLHRGWYLYQLSSNVVPRIEGLLEFEPARNVQTFVICSRTSERSCAARDVRKVFK